MSNDPDKWEAKELVDELNAGIAHPGEDQRSRGTCPYHNSLAKGMIWIIRRLNRDSNESWLSFGNLKIHGWLAVIAVILVSLGYFEYRRSEAATVRADDIQRMVHMELQTLTKGGAK